MGSFHVGGRHVQLSGRSSFERVLSEGGEPVKINLNGTYVVEQMYVQYFHPEQRNGKGPLVLWHGGGMTGVVWESTPDGRDGWLNFFIRQGWDVYVCDAVERGRSGFAPYPDIWPEKPITQTVDDVYSRFRIGNHASSYNADRSLRTSYENSRFPLEAFDQLSKQMVPRWAHTNEAMIKAFQALLERLGPASILCHSQSGPLALRLAGKHSALVKALVAVEPAGIPCFQSQGYRTPTLMVMGDNMESDERWAILKKKIGEFANSHDGVDVFSLPEVGIFGNSHLLMVDNNNIDIALRIDAWLRAHV
ncbi:hypothetical protein LSG25_09245 [Paralcaligenes sp. KSB-10]|uniref:alpha/beta fold hydrolase n=1 Tax=Paralcaligenes sp. KSB-10 TaxID=2901142 RepID=UPI001E5F33C8|nr:alpha/beta fold hydrolase [Paralcaligenes sp. KSB-10]UHL66294.1 hypothetical protein LSG25_09245 [Paralcaligenes sp. KSB-10]